MKLGIKFNINAVQAGQKSATLNAVPQLIAKSTAGQFTITAPVSKALGIAVGENVMFLNNFDAVEKAIMAENAEVVAYATENGYDLTKREDVDKLISELGSWYIAKGVKQYNRKGEPTMATVRMTKEEKLAYFEKMSDEEKQALVEAGVDVNDEEAVANAIALTYHASSGSKTSTTSTATGVGVQLNFTDSAIWGALKADLGENKEKKNRVFNVLLDGAEDAVFNNGFEDVKILAYPIEFVEDKDPIVRGEK